MFPRLHIFFILCYDPSRGEWCQDSGVIFAHHDDKFRRFTRLFHFAIKSRVAIVALDKVIPDYKRRQRAKDDNNISINTPWPTTNRPNQTTLHIIDFSLVWNIWRNQHINASSIYKRVNGLKAIRSGIHPGAVSLSFWGWVCWWAGSTYWGNSNDLGKQMRSKIFDEKGEVFREIGVPYKNNCRKQARGNVVGDWWCERGRGWSRLL